MSQLFVRTGITFDSSQQALAHIGKEMLAKGVVHDSYPQALVEREASFPTGIALERHAVAIPHCEAVHAKSPAIYLIRPDKPVMFQQADDDEEIAVSLIIASIAAMRKALQKQSKRLMARPCRAKFYFNFPDGTSQQPALAHISFRNLAFTFRNPSFKLVTVNYQANQYELI